MHDNPSDAALLNLFTNRRSDIFSNCVDEADVIQGRDDDVFDSFTEASHRRGTPVRTGARPRQRPRRRGYER